MNKIENIIMLPIEKYKSEVMKLQDQSICDLMYAVKVKIEEYKLYIINGNAKMKENLEDDNSISIYERYVEFVYKYKVCQMELKLRPQNEKYEKLGFI